MSPQGTYGAVRAGRIRQVVAGLLIAAALASGWAAWVASSAPLQRISASLLEGTGWTLESATPARLLLWPQPRIVLADVVIRRAQGPAFARIARLDADFAILGLVMGRTDIGDIRLVQPRVTVPERPFADWARSLDALSRQPMTGNRKVRVIDGRLEVGANGDHGRFEGVTVTVTTPADDAPLQVAGTFAWRGQQIDLSAVWPMTSQIRAGPANASLAVRAPLAELALKGVFTSPEAPQFDGDVAFNSSSVKDLLAWGGWTVPFSAGMGPVALASPVAWSERLTALRAVSLSVNGQDLEGAIVARFADARPIVSGTLAANGPFDLTAFLPPPALLRAPRQGWSRSRFDWSNFDDVDVDLRLSAATARLGRLSLDQIALSLILNDGRLEASLGRASVGGGTAKTRLNLQPRGTGLDLRVQGSFESVDVAGALADASGPAWLAGTARGQYSLEASGANAADMVANAQGRAALDVDAGSFNLADFGQTLRAFDRAGTATALSWRSGTTPFDQATATFAVAGGKIAVGPASLSSSAVQGSAAGTIDLNTKTLDLRASIGSVGQSGRSPIALDLMGPIETPYIRPDIRSLVERLRQPGPPG